MQFFENQKYSKDFVCSKVKKIFLKSMSMLIVNFWLPVNVAFRKECQEWKSLNALVAVLKYDDNTEHINSKNLFYKTTNSKTFLGHL